MDFKLMSSFSQLFVFILAYGDEEYDSIPSNGCRLLLESQKHGLAVCPLENILYGWRQQLINFPA